MSTKHKGIVKLHYSIADAAEKKVKLNYNINLKLASKCTFWNFDFVYTMITPLYSYPYKLYKHYT